MNYKLLSPMSDILFKRIFGEEKEIMMEVINAVIQPDHPVVELEYLQPELSPQGIKDKLTIVDVRCKDDNNRQFIVEMQVILKKGFHERVFYNASKVYGKQLQIGDDIKLLQPVYAISFINGNIEPIDFNWVHRYEMMKRGEINTSLNTITLIFVEIPKFIKFGIFDIDDPLHRWIRFLAEPDFLNEFPMERKHNYPNLKKAVAILDEASLSPAQQLGYDQYLDGIRYWNGTMIESFDDGFEEGTNKMIAIIKELKRGVKSPTEISIEFNVTLEKVIELKEIL